MINLQLLIVLSLLNFAHARFNIGIIDAIDHQIQQLGKKVEETKLETRRYIATTNSHGVVSFTVGSGRSLNLKVLDEEIPNLPVDGARVYLYTDYFGLEGCYLIYDPKGRYLPYISNLVDKIYLTYYRAIFTGTTNYTVNSIRMKDKNWKHLIDDLFWYIGYLKVDDLKKESPWWDRVDKQFTGFPVWKVVMFLVIDLEGEEASGTTVLSERYYLGKDDFFYNFYTNLGYKPEDQLVLMSVFSTLKNEIFQTGIGLVMIIPRKELKQQHDTLILSGTVKEKDKPHKVLEGINVFLHPPIFKENTYITGTDGKFRFYNLSSGSYTITLLKPGYKRNWREVIPPEENLEIFLSSHNNIPIIHSVTAERKIICLNEYSVLTSSASDPDGESLTYQWIPESGRIEGTGPKVNWRPANKPGVFNIVCRVYDNDFRFAEKSVSVQVINNNAPIISTVTANPPTITVNSTTTLKCEAWDPDGGDILSCHWSSPFGTIIGSGWRVEWRAPSSTSTYRINVKVKDGKMGVAEGYINVEVK